MKLYKDIIRDDEYLDGDMTKFFAVLNDSDILVVYDDHGYCSNFGDLAVAKIKIETIGPDNYEVEFGLGSFEDLKARVEEEDLKIMFFESLNGALEAYHRAVGN